MDSPAKFSGRPFMNMKSRQIENRARTPRRRVTIPKKPSAPKRPSAGQSKPLVAVAAAYARGTQSSEPQFREMSRDRCRIIHKELVGSITGSTAFAIQEALALNPGIAATFPWLATQAQGWEQYRFNKLRFEYVTRTGTQVPGSMMLVPDYDAADAPPASEQIASAYKDVQEDAPWKDICCDLTLSSMHPMGPRKFVRTGPLASNLDIKTYDVGNLFACTTDGTAVNWGKLWVLYDVEFTNPQLNPAGAGVLASQHIISTAPTTASNFASYTQGANSTNIVSVAGNVLTFNSAGRFIANVYGYGSTVVLTSAPAVGAGGSFVTTYGTAYPGANWAVFTGGTGASITVLINAVVGTTLTMPLTFTSGTNSELLIAQVPSNQA